MGINLQIFKVFALIQWINLCIVGLWKTDITHELMAFENCLISYLIKDDEGYTNITLRFLLKPNNCYYTTKTITGILDEEEFDDDNKCAKPVITLLANGKIKVESATEGAICKTTITASNAEPLTDDEISLSTTLTVYTITAYATAEGYDDSEVATATFRWEKAEGDINGDGNLNISDVVQLVNMILGQ